MLLSGATVTEVNRNNNNGLLPFPSSKIPRKRVAMIKPMVGKVRATSHYLPGGSFVFGVANKYDEEGAGKVIQNWAQPKPSKPQQMTMRSFPATNKEALRQGCFTAKAQREFAKNYPIMKKTNPKRTNKIVVSKTKKENNPPLIRDDGVAALLVPMESNVTVYESQQQQSFDIEQESRENNSNQEPVFGIKSVANDVPMKELLRCCAPAEFEEKDYPDRSNMKKKGRLPPAKSTKASRLFETSIKPSKEEVAAAQAKENFKIKRFIKVDSKVKQIIQQE